jgi:hypothetical protein
VLSTELARVPSIRAGRVRVAGARRSRTCIDCRGPEWTTAPAGGWRLQRAICSANQVGIPWRALTLFLDGTSAHQNSAVAPRFRSIAVPRVTSPGDGVGLAEVLSGCAPSWRLRVSFMAGPGSSHRDGLGELKGAPPGAVGTPATLKHHHRAVEKAWPAWRLFACLVGKCDLGGLRLAGFVGGRG